MLRVDKLFPKVQTWQSFNNKLVRHYKLPVGTQFRMVRKDKSLGASKTYRSDMEIRRKEFKRSDLNANDSVRLSEVTGDIEMMLAPHCRTDIVIVGPDRALIPKNTTLKSLRARGPTQAELDETATLEADLADDIATIKNDFDNWIFGIEHEGCCRDEALVPAVLAVLIDRCGTKAVELELSKHI